jgi:hypothetical protein
MLLVPRGGRRRSSTLGKSTAANPISIVLPMTASHSSANRELVVRSPLTPSVHVGTTRPRVGRAAPRSRWIPPDTRARMSAITVVVRRRRISPPTHVGSTVAQPLSPYGARGTARSGARGRDRQRQQVSARSPRRRQPPRAGSASPQGRRRALGQPPTLDLPARNRCRAETLICGGLE